MNLITTLSFICVTVPLISSTTLQCPCVNLLNEKDVTDIPTRTAFQNALTSLTSGGISVNHFRTNECATGSGTHCTVTNPGVADGNGILSGCIRMYAYAENVNGHSSNYGDLIDIGGCGQISQDYKNYIGTGNCAGELLQLNANPNQIFHVDVALQNTGSTCWMNQQTQPTEDPANKSTTLPGNQTTTEPHEITTPQPLPSTIQCPCVAQLNERNLTDTTSMVAFRNALTDLTGGSITVNQLDQCATTNDTYCTVANPGMTDHNDMIGGCIRMYAYAHNVNGQDDDMGDLIDIGGCGMINNGIKISQFGYRDCVGGELYLQASPNQAFHVDVALQNTGSICWINQQVQPTENPANKSTTLPGNQTTTEPHEATTPQPLPSTIKCPCVAQLNERNLTDTTSMVAFRNALTDLTGGLITVNQLDQCATTNDTYCTVANPGMTDHNDMIGGCIRMYAYAHNVNGQDDDMGDLIDIGGCGMINNGIKISQFGYRDCVGGELYLQASPNQAFHVDVALQNTGSICWINQQVQPTENPANKSTTLPGNQTTTEPHETTTPQPLPSTINCPCVAQLNERNLTDTTSMVAFRNALTDLTDGLITVNQMDQCATTNDTYCTVANPGVVDNNDMIGGCIRMYAYAHNVNGQDDDMGDLIDIGGCGMIKMSHFGLRGCVGGDLYLQASPNQAFHVDVALQETGSTCWINQRTQPTEDPANKPTTSPGNNTTTVPHTIDTTKLPTEIPSTTSGTVVHLAGIKVVLYLVVSITKMFFV